MTVNPEEVRGFFDSLAETWDAERCEDPVKIREILTLAGVRQGARVLDVACGTGVLFPYYLELGAVSVTGIDISPEMIKRASEKFPDSRIELVTGDAAEFPGSGYDCIVVFNALPHFPEPERLLGTLAGKLAPGGRLTVAHDRCRDSINGWHEQTATSVSLGLPPAETVAGWMRPALDVDTALDGGDRFIVSGTLRGETHE